MTEVITIGVDLAKNVFQVHGVDASGKTVIRRQLRRRQVLPFFRKQPACLVGMEACATSHHWAREIAALGHEVRPLITDVVALLCDRLLLEVPFKPALSTCHRHVLYESKTLSPALSTCHRHVLYESKTLSLALLRA